MQRVEFELRFSWLPDSAIFDKMIQLLLHSKVAKAGLYLIGDYHNEWLELTCYVETLDKTVNENLILDAKDEVSENENLIMRRSGKALRSLHDFKRFFL